VWLVSGLPTPAEGSGAITGRVLDAITGRPMPGVRVVAGGRGGDRHATSDALGRYRLEGLAPGQYTVRALHSRAFGAYGLTTPRQSAAFVAVGPGDTLSDLVVPLWPGSEISGTVRGLGRPLGGATVRLIPDFDEHAARELVADAAGRYHVSRLWPGTYRVVVPIVRDGSGAAQEAGDGSRFAGLTFLTTFAPATVDPEAAARVEVGVAEHRRRVDIQVQAIPAATLSGALEADPVLDTYFQFRLLRSRDLEGLELPDARFEDPDGGAFVLERLPRAAYTLEIERKVTGDDRIAYWPMRVPVDLTGGDLHLRLQFGEDTPLEPTIEIDAALDRQVTSVRGRVLGGAQNERLSVVIFPARRERWVEWAHGAERMTVQPIGIDRTYAIIGLPAGDYLLAAVDESRLAQWPLPYVLAGLVPRATRVTLEAGASRELDLQAK
jgi:hypothetical protein